MAKEMIDRQARDGLSEAIREYLGKGGFFGVRPLSGIGKYERSKDVTVAVVAEEFDEFLDNVVPTSDLTQKDYWDCIQRLLLLLSSECEIKVKTLSFWSFWQVSAIAISSIGIYLFASGHTEWLLYLLIPIWFITEASLSSKQKTVWTKTRGLVNLRSYPFKGRCQIKRVFAKVEGFHKSTFNQMTARDIGLIKAALVYFLIVLRRIVSTPFIIITQILPSQFTYYEVVEEQVEEKMLN